MGYSFARLLRVGARIENAKQHAHVLAQFSDLGRQLLPSGRGERVVLRAVVLLGRPPLRFHEPLSLEAMEGLVERGVFDGERTFATVADPARDSVAVHR